MITKYRMYSDRQTECYCEMEEHDNGEYVSLEDYNKLKEPKVTHNLTRQEKWEALKRMEAYGGGFAGALAIAWQRADMSNDRRLTEKFTDLLLRYHDMGKYT